jgi:hypothetical protein
MCPVKRQYLQAYYYSRAQGEERKILANQITNEYDNHAEILIEHADQATQDSYSRLRTSSTLLKFDLMVYQHHQQI